MNRFLEMFDKKVDEFSDHKEYPWLRGEADKAKSLYSSYGLEGIIAEDFIERIVAMPSDYILDWLNKKNELKWRESDKKMLAAIKGGFVHLLEKYKNHTISQIAKSAEKFYRESGYEIIEEGEKVFAIKEVAA